MKKQMQKTVGEEENLCKKINEKMEEETENERECDGWEEGGDGEMSEVEENALDKGEGWEKA